MLKKSWVIILLTLVLTACATTPTPYQPKTDGFGYEETKLQENVFRISFKANAVTEETDIMDYLYLRGAELTVENGYSHFIITDKFGKTEVGVTSTPRFRIGLGFISGSRNSAVGSTLVMPLGEPDQTTVPRYRLAVIVIQMLGKEDAMSNKDAFEAKYLIDSVREKLVSPEMQSVDLE